MYHKVIWEDKALESLSKLDEALEKEIRNKVEKHVASNPTRHGKLLKGNWEGRWRCRINDYRAIYEIVYELKEREIVIAVVKVGHRSTVYEGDHPRSTLEGLRITQRPQARDFSRKVARDNGKRKVGRNDK